jgi:hypothetical protein
MSAQPQNISCVLPAETMQWPIVSPPAESPQKIRQRPEPLKSGQQPDNASLNSPGGRRQATGAGVTRVEAQRQISPPPSRPTQLRPQEKAADIGECWGPYRCWQSQISQLATTRVGHTQMSPANQLAGRQKSCREWAEAVVTQVGSESHMTQLKGWHDTNERHSQISPPHTRSRSRQGRVIQVETKGVQALYPGSARGKQRAAKFDSSWGHNKCSWTWHQSSYPAQGHMAVRTANSQYSAQSVWCEELNALRSTD